ncbi:MAG: VPLPA-CTERM sorting domain-containing protein, partial [Paracoccaceae bacterium]
AATYTFTSNGYERIPATGTSGTTNPYPLTLDVSGLANVTDVNLTILGLTHTYSADLDMYLRGPYPSATVRLMTDEGGGYNWTDDDLTFDSQASRGYPIPGFSQSIRPDNSLSYFNGRDPNGAWRLYIYDDARGDRGHIDGWSLTFEADSISEVPLPAGFPLLIAGLGALGFMSRRKKS